MNIQMISHRTDPNPNIPWAHEVRNIDSTVGLVCIACAVVVYFFGG